MPAAARPGTMLELEQRVDAALAVARSAEAAALAIGAAAFDAAEQAHRAADFAERAVTRQVVPAPPGVGGGVEPAPAENGVEVAIEDAAGLSPWPNGAADPDERLRLFSERADRVMTRLRALEPAA